ncbi:MAG TPA: metalloregulator ArsR/SmtB family transcription factor [Ktedonobacteraceae bacterium]|nr:metalloregulator ArsR/SmtB family transcription factor [Ktedonobacteraceae bacterium]
MDERQGQIEATRRYGIARMEFEAAKLEPLLRFGRALADPMRIRMLGLLAQRSMYGQELAEALNVQPPTISHHLSLLKAAGLVQVRRENNFHHYSVNEEQLRRTAGLLTVENLRNMAQMAANETEASRLAPSEDEDRAMMQEAFFKDGRLLSIPTHSRVRRFVVEKIAGAFEWGHLYEEKEVNVILKQFHDDVATLRRALIDEKLMMRENGKYWLIRPHR